jgi:hypothetical protein
MALESLGSSQKKFTERQLVQHCLEADTNTLEAILTHRNVWDSNWAIYNSQFDFRDKAEWQSRNSLPKANMAVRLTRTMMKQSIIKADRFFGFKGLNSDSKAVQKDIEDGLLRIMDQAQFKQKKFEQGLFRGLLENLIIFKVFPTPLAPEDHPIHPLQEYKLVISPVSAYDFRIDTTGRGRFVIHRVRMDLSDFRKLVDRGVYRREALMQVLADFAQKEEDIKRKTREGLVDVGDPPWRKEVELLEYWGDVDDEYGQRVYENVTFTVVNEAALARFPVKNPYRHGKPPFVWGPIIEKVGAVYAEGFLDSANRISRMMNEVLNMTLDSNLAASVKAYEINLDYIHNPSELKSGLYPGKAVKVRGVPPGGSAIRDFSLGEVSQSSLAILTMLERAFQDATGVNEFIAGSTSGAEKTATESKIKAGASQSLMQAIGVDIEDNVLEPVVDMVYKIFLQYNPEIFGDRIQTVPADTLKFHYSVRGMSKVLSQIDELNKIFMWIGMVGKTPIAQRVNWNRIGEMSARLINMDPSELLLQDSTEPPEPGEGATQPEADGAEAQLQNLLRMTGGQGG